MEKKNVLIFPAGSASAIDSYKSIKNNIHFNVFGASGKADHSEYIYPPENLYVSKDLYITNVFFVSALNSVIRRWKIDFIIPQHDTIARALMEKESEINAKIICSPLETAIIAENKGLMYEHLKDCAYCPEIYDEDNIKFPAFLKPFVSAGGKGTAKINDYSELERITKNRKGYVLCEYLPGSEYTVDCFTNSERKLIFIGARTRENITNGITYHSERVQLTDEIKSIAEDLNKRFVFRGAWYFQIKEDKNGALKFMEFSARQAGTMTFFRQLGVNFTALSLFDFMGYPVEILYNDYDLTLDRDIETLFDFHYDYKRVYLDYDDTLIVNGHVNTDMMKFLYQCVNNKIKIIMLTAHDGDIYESMNKYKIPRELFDEIIIVAPGTRKADYINNKESVFIDNYFPERLAVSKKLNIPVFDVDAFSCLIDDRKNFAV